MSKAVFFDLGNVLLFFDHREICARLGRRSGLPSAAVHSRVFGNLGGDLELAYDRGEISDAEFHRQVCDRLAVEIPFDDFARDWGDIFWPNAAMLDVMRRLRRLYKVAIISNTNPLHIRYAHQFIDFDSEVDAAIFSFEQGTAKPDSRMWSAALEATGVSAGNAFYIDDYQKYVEAARSLGIPGCFYNDPDTTIRTLIAHGFSYNY